VNPLSLAPDRSAFSYVTDHLLLGASTGFMSSVRGDWPQSIARALAISDAAVELSALSGPELAPLVNFLRGRNGTPLPFGYVSVHGPSKGWPSSINELAAQLQDLPDQVESVILHPDTIDDCGPLKDLGSLVVLENLDHRPSTGRDVAEMMPWFEALPDAGFCFDIAHVTALEGGLELGHSLLDAFGGRLRQVHLSSFVRDGAKHVPLTEQDARRFASLLGRCLGVPWILEAPLVG
jgi:hypothetical protein